jgi:uncharacterized membrane protein
MELKVKTKSVYNNDSINNTIAIVILSTLMMGFSLYLTQHYFDIKFPTGLTSGSLCNINSFFNCDKTTTSPLGAPFNIPISIFGIIIGLLTFMGIIVKNEEYEKTVFFTLLVNGIGCVLLFLYSLFVLKGLCPFCTLYYIASLLTLFFFYKNSETWQPNFGFLGSFALVVIVISLLMRNNINDRIAENEKNINAIGNDLIKQYFSLPNLGTPNYPSIYKLANNNNAPIKMVIFSDFECPACKALSEQIPQIIARYGTNIDISYYFYPLDNSCNPSMQRPLHQYACQAAYASVCMPSSDFFQVHEVLFKNQAQFESGYVAKYIKDNKLESCVKSNETKDKVSKIIAAATPFNVASTPTFLVNGVKIEGVLPFDQLSIIFDEIVKRAGK